MDEELRIESVDTSNLQGALLSLRRAFHRRLAKKKGLLISEVDIHSLVHSNDDYNVHMRLARISKLRRILYFIGINKNG